MRVAEQHVWDALVNRIDRRLLLIIASALLVVGIGMTTKPIHTRDAFYAVVAQVLPVLMLVGAVDGRYFRERSDANPFDRFLIRGFWVGGLAGELEALAVLARGRDSLILRGLVVYGLLMIGVLVSVYRSTAPHFRRQAA